MRYLIQSAAMMHALFGLGDPLRPLARSRRIAPRQARKTGKTYPYMSTRQRTREARRLARKAAAA